MMDIEAEATVGSDSRHLPPEEPIESSGSQTDENIDNGPLLPPRPVEPDPADCCGTGCTPCVFDLYEQELQMWETECQRIQQGKRRDVNPELILSPDQYTKFELAKIEPLTSDASLYTFTVPGYQRLPIAPGQHVVLRHTTKHEVFTRQYTPITPPDTDGKMVFVIKLYDNGDMSQYIRMWQAGDVIEWRGPFGNFSYKRNSYDRLVMFAAGTGIAPMLQILQSVVLDERDDTRLHLVYSCRTYSSILCKTLLDELRCYWNVSIVYYLSQDADDGNKCSQSNKVIYSRLTKAHVMSELGSNINNTRVLVCGTKSFDKDIINYIKCAGVTEGHFFKF